MKHLSHRTIAIIVALLSTLSLALAVISLPHQAYAVDGTDGTSGTNSTSQGSDGDSAPIAGPVPNIIVTNFTYGGDSVAAGADFNLDFTFQNMGQVAVTNMVITTDRRAYHLALESTDRTAMAAISWTYPQDRYCAVGIFGQSITIDPTRKLVIAMVSAWPAATGQQLSVDRSEFQAKLVAAAGTR